MTSEADSTRVLLARAARGEREALDRVCERYLPALRRWARGRLPAGARDLVDTDDLVQETLLQTVRRVEAFEAKHSGAFPAYVRRALLNRIRDQARRVQRRPKSDGTLSRQRDPGPSPLEQAIGSETLEKYEHGLESLQPRERAAVVARLELGHSYSEVADIIGYPSADAARMAVTRAIGQLAREISLA